MEDFKVHHQELQIWSCSLWNYCHFVESLSLNCLQAIKLRNLLIQQLMVCDLCQPKSFVHLQLHTCLHLLSAYEHFFCCIPDDDAEKALVKSEARRGGALAGQSHKISHCSI